MIYLLQKKAKFSKQEVNNVWKQDWKHKKSFNSFWKITGATELFNIFKNRTWVYAQNEFCSRKD